MKYNLGAKFAALGLAAAMALPLAACGTETASLDPDALMDQVYDNMGTAQNCDLTVGIDLDISESYSGENERMQMNAAVDMALKQDPFQLHMAVSAASDAAGQQNSEQTELYLVPDGDDYVMYLSSDEDGSDAQWQKESVSADKAEELRQSMEDASSGTSGQELSAMVRDAMDLEITGTEQVNGVQAVAVSGELRFADLIAAMEETGTGDMMDLDGILGSSEEMASVFEQINVPMTFYVDAENAVLLQCTADLKSTLEQVFVQLFSTLSGADNTASLDEDTLLAMIPIEISTAQIEITIHAFGDSVADITVPQSVISQAVETESDADLETLLPGLGTTV